MNTPSWTCPLGQVTALGFQRRLAMKRALPFLISSLIAVAGAASIAPAQTTDAHKIVSPQQIKWGPAPAAYPPGAQVAVLHGNPGNDGPFVTRLKFPKGFQIAPHWHPTLEVVTVISGTFRLGMGETADPGKAQALPAGSLIVLPPQMAHFASADEETVVQINANGPWGTTYVNPKDDPRQQKTQ
jgi:quercetin dioxygenase-like cupin family protein